MKSILVVLGIFLLTACTSLQPIEKSPTVIQTQIQEGNLLSVGNRVKIIDVNGRGHEFKITKISNTHLFGKSSSLAIKDIANLQVKEVSSGKSAFAIPTTIGALAILGFLLNK